MEQFKLPVVEEEKTRLKTIRIKAPQLDFLEKLAKKNSLSVNKIINACIDYALENLSEEYLIPLEKNKNGKK